MGLRKEKNKVEMIADFYRQAGYQPTKSDIEGTVRNQHLSPAETNDLYAFYGFEKPRKKHNAIQRVMRAVQAPKIAPKSISEAYEYIQSLHEKNDTDALLFALAIEGGEVSQISFRISEVDENFVKRLLSLENVFLSVNSFFKRERSQNALQRFSAVFLDFDDVSDPEAFLDDLEASGRFDSMQPSLAVASGNGLHLYWLLKDCYANRLTKDFVGRVQQSLLKRFPEADKKVKDFSRVMRIPGSVHLKDRMNPKDVRLIELDSKPYYRIDELGREVLPFTRAEVTVYKERATKSKDQKMNIVQFQKNLQSLHYSRMKDIELYLKSDNPAIHRKTALFLYRHFAYRISGNAQKALQATLQLNNELENPLSQMDLANHTSGADQGIDYNYKTTTIVELLEIEQKLQTKMSTLIGKTEKNAREKKRMQKVREGTKKETTRRKESLVSRANALKNIGYTKKQIASEIGVSESTVKRYLKQNLK